MNFAISFYQEGFAQVKSREHCCNYTLSSASIFSISSRDRLDNNSVIVLAS